MKRMILAVALIAATSALAQAPAATTAPAAEPTPVDPVRLVAAKAVIDQIMPPATREQMIEAMIAPTLATISQTVTNDPKMAELLGEDSKAQASFTRFMERQNARTMSDLRSELPAMVEAMSRAYARRFDERQLKEISAFFATPTGKTYLEQSPGIMSDPDVLAWQRRLMSKSMSTIHEDIETLSKELGAEFEKRK
jgi:hypothetical protein